MQFAPEEINREKEARKELLRLVSTKERCSSDLKHRLEKKGFSEEEILLAIEWGRECNAVDDCRFIDVFIRKNILSGRGRQGIEYDLDAFELDPSCLPGWPLDYFAEEEDEIKRAIALLNKKPPTARNKRESAYRRLYQKGFSSSVSAAAARIWTETKTS